ncbi:MAG: inositol monophosphatase [Proteobacteria bacterium]|nr:inositol monophosphatase [Pseudomonadota bacterium]
MGSPLINVMTGAVLKAGKGLLRDFGEIDRLQVSRKGTSDFVTVADTRTEKLLHKELKAARPDFGFLMEEGGELPGKDATHRWIIDPIDGTHNFIHAIPYFCISVGLEHLNHRGQREIIAAVIYDPLHNDLFWAEKGKGAFLNDRKLAVSQRNTLEDALFVVGKHFSGGVYDSTTAALTQKVAQAGAAVRYFGATALDLAYLAAGRLDGCWHYTLRPWDIAAGILLIQEAGGIVTDLEGKRADAHAPNLMCANQQLHAPLQKLLASLR